MEGKKVLFISSEVVPYMPQTEISNLTYNLPKVVNENGGLTRIFIPKYGNINERRHQLHEVIRLSGINLIIDDMDMPLILKVASIPKERMQVYFIDSEDYFKGRSGYSKDDDGNTYIIKAKNGIIDNENQDLIHLKNVKAEINFDVNKKIFITAKQATYNNDNFKYHCTVPTDSIIKFSETVDETINFGLDKAESNAKYIGSKVRKLFESKGFNSIADNEYKSPTVIVSQCKTDIVQKFKNKVNENVTTSTTLWSVIFLFPFSVLFEAPWNASPTIESTLSLLYLGVIATGLAWLIRFRILTVNGLVFQTQVAYLIPIFGIVFGFVLMDEIITWKVIASLVVILFGIYIFKKNNKGLVR